MSQESVCSLIESTCHRARHLRSLGKLRSFISTSRPVDLYNSQFVERILTLQLHLECGLPDDDPRFEAEAPPLPTLT